MSLLDSIIKKAKKTLTTDYSKNFPECQGVWLNKPGSIMPLYHYGSAGNAPVGSYMIMFNPGGQEEERVAIEFHRESLPKELLANEYICGNFVIGSTEKFDKDGNVIFTVKKDLTENITGNVTTTIGGTQTQVVTGVVSRTTSATTSETSTTLHTITSPNISLVGILTVTGPIVTVSGGSATIDGAFGCNGATAQTSVTFNADATNLAEVIALTNQIKATLIANGIGV